MFSKVLPLFSTLESFIEHDSGTSSEVHVAMQVAALNGLNIILVHIRPQDPRVAEFLSDRTLLPKAVGFVSEDRAFFRVRPKALLTCGLMLRLGPEWLRIGVESELLGRISSIVGRAGNPKHPVAGGGETSDRELAEYTMQCSDVVLSVLSDLVAQLLEQVCAASFCHI